MVQFIFQKIINSNVNLYAENSSKYSKDVQNSQISTSRISTKKWAIIKPHAVCVIISISIISIKHHLGLMTVLFFISPHGVLKLSTVTIINNISVYSFLSPSRLSNYIWMFSNGSSVSAIIIPMNSASIQDIV